VLEAVYEHVRRTPLAVGVVDGDRETTYRQLWDRAERTRAALGEAGVAAGTVVAIAARRGAGLLGAVLGTWLAGGAYLPVGGHSLLGARLLKRVEDTLGASLRLADLFDAPTPASLAETIRRTRAGQASEPSSRPSIT
jgi:non-ribosomal peptide synthetase component F